MYHLSDQQIRQQIDKMFLRYDKDRSNTLDPSQLAPFLNEIFDKTKYPSHVSNVQQARQLLRYIDINHDGAISKLQIFNVFKYLITSSAQINGVDMNQYQNQNQNQNQNYGGNNNNNQYGGYGYGQQQQQYGNPYQQYGGNQQSYGNNNNYGYNQNQGQHGNFNNPNQYGNQNPYGKSSQGQDVDISQPYFSNSNSNTNNNNNNNNSNQQKPNILGLLANSLHQRSNNNQSQNNQGNSNKGNYSQW